MVAQYGPVAEGRAAWTSAGRLNFKGVIHAVGPMWSGGFRGEDELLASAVRSVLELASNFGVRLLFVFTLASCFDLIP